MDVTEPSHTLPLAGVRVVEAAQMISAPLATSILSDQGAEVIKIEAPTGDRMRGLGDFRNGMGSVFHACNRGKKSVVIDTKTDDGRDTLINLMGTADVFVQNFRPGAVERMGIGPDEICARFPSLIYVSISGFGPTGPYADQMVYDFVIQGLSGSAALEGLGGPLDRNGKPTPRLSKGLVIDKATALTAAQAISAALFQRERAQKNGGEGGGQHLQLTMLDAGLQFFWPDGGWNHALQGDDIQVMPHPAANYDVRTCSDGYVTLNLGTNSTWGRLCAAVDPALADDPRFATFTDRQAHAAELGQAVDAVLSTMTVQEALARFKANDLPGGAVATLDDVHLDPQVDHNDAFVEWDSPSIGTIRDVRPAARFHATRGEIAGEAPILGAHTEAVLSAMNAGLEA